MEKKDEFKVEEAVIDLRALVDSYSALADDSVAAKVVYCIEKALERIEISLQEGMKPA